MQLYGYSFRSSHLRRSIKKGVLKIFAKSTRKNLCSSFHFKKVTDAASKFIKKETPPQVFPTEFCEILATPFLQNTSV